MKKDKVAESHRELMGSLKEAKVVLEEKEHECPRCGKKYTVVFYDAGLCDDCFSERQEKRKTVQDMEKVDVVALQLVGLEEYDCMGLDQRAELCVKVANRLTMEEVHKRMIVFETAEDILMKEEDFSELDPARHQSKVELPVKKEVV